MIQRSSFQKRNIERQLASTLTPKLKNIILIYLSKEPSIKDVNKIFGFLVPHPLVRKFTQPPLLSSSNMSAFGPTPLPPWRGQPL